MTARQLAEKLLQWSRGDPIDFALHLAGIDRDILREAYRLVETDIIPRQVAAKVDADFARRGRYSTDAELAALDRASRSKPRPCFTQADMARLAKIVRETATAVRRQHPGASQAELAALIPCVEDGQWPTLQPNGVAVSRRQRRGSSAAARPEPVNSRLKPRRRLRPGVARLARQGKISIIFSCPQNFWDRAT
jgi:hypothetical protein